MAERIPLYLDFENGLIVPLDPTDTLPLANIPPITATIYEEEIDLGTTPVAEASVNIVNASIDASSKIIGGVAYLAPTGKDLDELEMDAIELKFEPGVGSFNVKVKGLEGYLSDKFKIWYMYYTAV